jgi:hypothetical protein
MVFDSTSRDVIMLEAMVDTDTVEVEGLRLVRWAESLDKRMSIHVREEGAACTFCGMVVPPVEQLPRYWQLRDGMETCSECRQEAIHWIKRQMLQQAIHDHS